MPNRKLKISLLSIILVLCPLFQAAAQYSDIAVDNVISEKSIRDNVEFLCDSLCAGRAMGTSGSSEAGFWLTRQFRHLGLMPFDGRYVSSFSEEGHIGHNIVAFYPGRITQMTRRYIIVASHYDHVGTLNGILYPGADSNASGVSALLSIARMFQAARSMGCSYDTNIIFVALDGKQFSMAGSKALYTKIASGQFRDPVSKTVITPSQIDMFVNLDILGSTLAPLTNGRDDFLIMLGGDNVQRDRLRTINMSGLTRMELGFDYYGSEDFTDLFYRRICDQRIFIQNKVPSVMFTSGITMKTNRVDDNPDSLDYKVLLRRVRLIFHWLERSLQ